MASREQVKARMPMRWKTLAKKSAARVDALLHAITTAERLTELEREPVRRVLVAEYESFMYHAARAEGDDHRVALDKSREGRKQVDALAGWS